MNAKPTRTSASVKTQTRFGAHMSTAGGLHTAFERATSVGCDVMQVFVKNQRQWRAKPLDDEAVAQWKEAQRLSGINTVVAHDAYLINLAAPDEKIWQLSLDAFVDELTRCKQAGIGLLVTHPGSHNGSGEAAGISRVARALDRVYETVGDGGVCTLLEVTAGQGTNLGWRMQHLADIMAAVRSPIALGVCLDTCHLFAAGYDLTSDEGYETMMAELQSTIGLDAVRCVHMNDSKKPLGSRVDRHEHIGKGFIGRKPFARIVADERLAGLPMILETPKEQDARGKDMDAINLALLRRFGRASGT